MKNYIITQTQTQFLEGVEAIDETIEKMQLLTQMMYQNNDFTSLCKQGSTYTQENLLALRSCYTQLSSISNVAHYVPYMFVLFDSNDFFLSNEKCNHSFSTYYNALVSVTVPQTDLATAPQLKEFLFETYRNGQNFISPEAIMYTLETQKTLEKPILYLTNATFSRKASNHLFCFVFSKELLLENILTSEYMDDSFLCIQELASGSELLTHGIPSQDTTMGEIIEHPEASRDYYTLQHAKTTLGWKITAGISVSYVDRQMQSVERLLIIYLGFGFLTVFLLTLYFSLSRYYGFKQVLLSIPAEDLVHPDSRHINDYKLLTTNMTKLNEQKQTYRTQAELLQYQNRAIMLENYITRGENTLIERQRIVEYLGKEPEFFCVVTVRSLQTAFHADSNTSVLDMIEFLTQNEVALLCNVHSGVSDDLFLIELSSSQKADTRDLLQVFEDMAKVISGKYECVLHIGISSVGTDLSNISSCYEQTKRIIQSQYMSENENVVQVYDHGANSLRENPITLEFMTHLYTTLICGRYTDAEKELDRIAGFYRRMPYLYETHREQLFYSLKNLFHTVVLYLNCENYEQFVPVYTDSIPCTDILSAYKAYAAWICSSIAKNKKSHNDILKDKILAIIKEQYMDCELSAYTVSKEAGITENYLGKFMKEQTGESFSAYLLRIRIEKAREYLEQTDYSNKEIADLVGFASTNTFYRNFQKFMGVSPKFYKDKAIQEMKP